MDFNGYGALFRRVRSVAAWTCVSWVCATSTLAQADDSPYTPSFDRPGFGFAPNALPLGGFTWEQGLPSWTLSNTDDTRSSQFTTDTLLRLGVGGDMELQLGTSPFNRLVQRTAGISQASYGHGDSSLGLKWAPASSSQIWSWGLLGTVEFPDGADGIRNPERQYTLGASVDQNLDDKRSLTYVAQWQRMGNQGTYLAAGNYGYAISKVWGVYGEIAAMHQQGKTGGLFGAGVTYLPNARVQWDMSFDHRFVGQAPQWMADFGISINFTP